jgi:hypothetical protein
MQTLPNLPALINFDPATVVALIVGISFAAGLNVYATVATLGLLGHFHWVVLPHGLEVLDHPWIIALSGALFLIEVFADKVPAFDLLWNAAHTFIRVPVAALLAFRASSQLSPEMQALTTADGALIAMLAHTSKTAARTAVTPSPEPISNIALSSTEDVAAIGLTWIATHHPYLGAGITAAACIALLLSMRWLVIRMRRSWSNSIRWFRSQDA